jgi:fatty-acyl-CoA synthase
MEAAVVGRVCDVRDEVPVVFVVPRPDLKRSIEPQEVIDLIGTKFALWQLPKPEDVRFVESLPKTGVGKLDKKVIRRMLVN